MPSLTHWAWGTRFFSFLTQKLRGWGISCIRKLRKTEIWGILRVNRVKMRIVSCNYYWILVMINIPHKSINKTWCVYLLWSSNKVWRFFFQKRKSRKPRVITKFPLFLKGSFVEHQYLTVLNSECIHLYFQ